MFPILFHFGHLTLPTFGVLAALGLMLALVLSERTATLVDIDPAKLWNAGIFAVLAAFLLSRLLLVVFYWHSFRAFPLLLLTVPSLTASGLVLTLHATTAWLRLKRIPLLRALDAWTPCATLVWASLALGHFAEGSDPGMPSTLSWALAPMRGETTRVHPVALYVTAFALLLTLFSYRRLRTHKPAAALTLITAGIGQFLFSFVRQPGAQSLLGLDLLQAISLVMIGAGALLAATMR